MKNFNFYAPTEVVFGDQSEDQSEEQVAQLVQPRLYGHLWLPESAASRRYGSDLQNGERLTPSLFLFDNDG